MAIEARQGDRRVRDFLLPLDDAVSGANVAAERAFLRAIGGGCKTPIGALATGYGWGMDTKGMVASPDGAQILRYETWGGAGLGRTRSRRSRAGAGRGFTGAGSGTAIENCCRAGRHGLKPEAVKFPASRGRKKGQRGQRQLRKGRDKEQKGRDKPCPYFCRRRDGELLTASHFNAWRFTDSFRNDDKDNQKLPPVVAVLRRLQNSHHW